MTFTDFLAKMVKVGVPVKDIDNGSVKISLEENILEENSKIDEEAGGPNKEILALIKSLFEQEQRTVAQQEQLTALIKEFNEQVKGLNLQEGKNPGYKEIPENVSIAKNLALMLEFFARLSEELTNVEGSELGNSFLHRVGSKEQIVPKNWTVVPEAPLYTDRQPSPVYSYTVNQQTMSVIDQIEADVEENPKDAEEVEVKPNKDTEEIVEAIHQMEDSVVEATNKSNTNISELKQKWSKASSVVSGIFGKGGSLEGLKSVPGKVGLIAEILDLLKIPIMLGALTLAGLFTEKGRKFFTELMLYATMINLRTIASVLGWDSMAKKIDKWIETTAEKKSAEESGQSYKIRQINVPAKVTKYSEVGSSSNLQETEKYIGAVNINSEKDVKTLSSAPELQVVTGKKYTEESWNGKPTTQMQLVDAVSERMAEFFMKNSYTDFQVGQEPHIIKVPKELAHAILTAVKPAIKAGISEEDLKELVKFYLTTPQEAVKVFLSEDKKGVNFSLEGVFKTPEVYKDEQGNYKLRLRYKGYNYDGMVPDFSKFEDETQRKNAEAAWQVSLGLADYFKEEGATAPLFYAQFKHESGNFAKSASSVGNFGNFIANPSSGEAARAKKYGYFDPKANILWKTDYAPKNEFTFSSVEEARAYGTNASLVNDEGLLLEKRGFRAYKSPDQEWSADTIASIIKDYIPTYKKWFKAPREEMTPQEFAYTIAPTDGPRYYMASRASYAAAMESAMESAGFVDREGNIIKATYEKEPEPETKVEPTAVSVEPVVTNLVKMSELPKINTLPNNTTNSVVQNTTINNFETIGLNIPD